MIISVFIQILKESFDLLLIIFTTLLIINKYASGFVNYNLLNMDLFLYILIAMGITQILVEKSLRIRQKQTFIDRSQQTF